MILIYPECFRFHFKKCIIFGDQVFNGMSPKLAKKIKYSLQAREINKHIRQYCIGNENLI